MYLRPRHRRGSYPLAAEHTLPAGLRLLLALGALIVISYLLWTLFLRLLGVSGSHERAGAFLAVEDRGTVTVTIDGKEQRTENGMMVFPGEKVQTAAAARASLRLFDSSRVRLHEGTALTIGESSRGKRDALFTLELEQGNVWVKTASASSFTGSVVRKIVSPTLDFTLSPGTEALLSPTSVMVFSSDSDGVLVSLDGHPDFMISEGQQWLLPGNGQVGSNVYEYRSPLDPETATSPFVTESRALLSVDTAAAGSASSGQSTELLTLTAPEEGAQITTPTVIVRGTVGAGVTRISVNGYPALLDLAKRTFVQEVSPPDLQANFDIVVQAQDDARNVLAEERRSVKRGPPPPIGAPAVTAPARTGDTYRTRAEEIILRGTAPADARGIMVNDYKLQLFDPAKGEWSYVASLRLRNMIPGTNVYDIYALDATGKKSEASRLTVIQGEEGPEGVVTNPSSAASSVSPGTLPTNAPLQPGTLQITLPTPGTAHTETGTGFLLEGTTSARTASIWVNDYKLQLYRAGKTSWNYIVDTAINNLKTGKNTYTVVARGADEQILDSVTYTVDYVPPSR